MPVEEMVSRKGAKKTFSGLTTINAGINAGAQLQA